MTLSTLILALLPFQVAMPLDSDSLPTAVLESVWTMGDVGSIPYPLTTVSAVLAAADGTVFVGQPQAHTVLEVSPGVREVVEIGREGDGPGEFRGIAWLGFHRDSLWVADRTSSRITLFDRARSPTRTFGFRHESDEPQYHSFGPEMLMHDGTVWTRLTSSPQLRADGIVTETLFLRTDQRGSWSEVLFSLDLSNERVIIRNRSRRGSRLGVLQLEQPFADNPLWSVRQDGVEAVIVDRYVGNADVAPVEVIRVSASGDTISRRTYSFTPQPLSSEQLDAAVRRGIDFVLSARNTYFGSPRGAERGIRDLMHLPAYAPPVTNAVLDATGRLWLRQPPRDGEAEWTVLDAEGDPLARLRLPDRAWVAQARDDRVWVVHYDDLDVATLTQYEWKVSTAQAGASSRPSVPSAVPGGSAR